MTLQQSTGVVVPANNNNGSGSGSGSGTLNGNDMTRMNHGHLLSSVENNKNNSIHRRNVDYCAPSSSLITTTVASGSFSLPVANDYFQQQQEQYNKMATLSCSAQQQQQQINNKDDHQVSQLPIPIPPSHCHHGTSINCYPYNNNNCNNSRYNNNIEIPSHPTCINMQPNFSSLFASIDVNQTEFDHLDSSSGMVVPPGQGFDITTTDEQEIIVSPSLMSTPNSSLTPSNHNNAENTGYYYLHHQQQQQQVTENMYSDLTPVDSLPCCSNTLSTDNDIHHDENYPQQQHQMSPMSKWLETCCFDSTFTESATPSTPASYQSFSPYFPNDEHYHIQCDQNYYDHGTCNKKMSTTTESIIAENSTSSPAVLGPDNNTDTNDINIITTPLHGQQQQSSYPSSSSNNNANYFSNCFTAFKDQMSNLLFYSLTPENNDDHSQQTIAQPSSSPSQVESKLTRSNDRSNRHRTNGRKELSTLRPKPSRPSTTTTATRQRGITDKSENINIALPSSFLSTRRKRIDKQKPMANKNNKNYKRKKENNGNNNRKDDNNNRNSSTPCSHCGKTFSREQDRKRHENSVHTNKRIFGCDECDRYFPRKDSLQRHQRKKTNCSQSNENITITATTMVTDNDSNHYYRFASSASTSSSSTSFLPFLY
ncbi:hypothetical protein BDA99DRAFT_539111 [Phascolomyces articulosus]|uniref:C2H2-type domain-containing protein n=1 Tax=Phascolomyces articulosus TaxID=60185 RepID=A0AAD5K6V0_9FUNG|nr:hypothetical protein BDA99DRAFT_539111 [Phascolomyces articulosus]